MTPSGLVRRICAHAALTFSGVPSLGMFMKSQPSWSVASLMMSASRSHVEVPQPMNATVLSVGIGLSIGVELGIWVGRS